MMIDGPKSYSMALSAASTVVSTSTRTLLSLLDDIPPGRYRVDEFTEQPGLLPPNVALWGWIVKRENGSVDIESMREPG